MEKSQILEPWEKYVLRYSHFDRKGVIYKFHLNYRASLEVPLSYLEMLYTYHFAYGD